MSTKLKIVGLCILAVLYLLAYVGIVTDFVQNGVRWQNIVSSVIAVYVTVWWILDFRRIIKESKASKDVEVEPGKTE